MKLRQTLALFTLAGFFLLSLIVANVYQPTMNMDLHCSVHEHILQVFGGSCDQTGLGLFTSVGAFFGTTLSMLLVLLLGGLFIFNKSQSLQFARATAWSPQRWRQLIRPNITFFIFIFSGQAAFRNFI